MRATSTSRSFRCWASIEEGQSHQASVAQPTLNRRGQSILSSMPLVSEKGPLTIGCACLVDGYVVGN